MSRSTLIKIALAVIAAAITVAAVVVYLSTRTESKLQDARKIIEGVVRTEMLPSDYFLANGSDLQATLGFGRRYADHLYMDWRANDAYFMAVFAYDKEFPYPLIGYSINAWVKDPEELGYELASKLYNSLPDDGWRQAGPKEYSWANTSISSVLWNSGSDQVYVMVLRTIYTEPQILLLPNRESVQDVVRITYLYVSSLNTNPGLNDMKRIQDSDLKLWGGAALPP